MKSYLPQGIYDIWTIDPISLWFSPMFQPRSLTAEWFVQWGPFSQFPSTHISRNRVLETKTRWQKQLHEQEKPDRFRINQMAGVRAFSYRSGPSVRDGMTLEPEIKVADIRPAFQGEVFPTVCPLTQRGCGSLIWVASNQRSKAVKKFLKESANYL